MEDEKREMEFWLGNFKLTRMFSDALAGQFETSQREYLYDLFPLTHTYFGVKRFLDQLDYLEKFVIGELGTEIFCCFRYGSDHFESEISQCFSEDLKRLGLDYHDPLFLTDKVEQDEIYRQYLIHKVHFKDIKVLLWGALASATIKISPTCRATIFLFGSSSRKIFHVYDDRGFDIVRL